MSWQQGLLSGYLLLINLAAFTAMGVDKQKAVRGSWRIRERTLFLLALFGGSLGGWIGMYMFHHKTKHTLFVIGFPALLILHIGVLIFFTFLS